MTELPLGAHVTSPRLGFVHHGIYVGYGQVIHYGGYERGLRRAPIQVVALEQFTKGRGLSVLTPACPEYTGAACVERARSRLGENRYELWSNNCEHFVEWCVSGSSRSRQVEALRDRLNRAFRPLTRIFRVGPVAPAIHTAVRSR